MADYWGLRWDDGSQGWDVVTRWAQKAQTEISAQDSDGVFVRHRTEETKISD